MVAQEIEDGGECRSCGGKAVNRCSRCHAVRYCGINCQKKDWSRHKSECKPKKKEEVAAPGSLNREEEKGPCAVCNSVTKQKCANCKKVYYCQRQCQQKDWKEHRAICFPFKVEENDKLGRFAVATRAIKAGDVILREFPLLLGSLEPANTPCLGCYKSTDGSYRCRRCGWVLCGEACEESDQHKPECEATGRVKSSVESLLSSKKAYRLILALRGLSLRADKQKAEQLKNLQCSPPPGQKVNPKKAEVVKDIIQTLKSKLKIKYDSKDKKDNLDNFVKDTMGCIDVNGFELSVGETELMGIYPNCAMLEHSCTPNTKHKFNSSNQMVLKAATDIAEGEHVSTMYTKILYGTAARRKDLLENKYFLCSCNRCADTTELGTYLSALRCLRCSGDGFILPIDPLSLDSDWKCNSCASTMSASEAESRTKEVEVAVEQLIATPTEKVLEKLISESVATKVHPNHFSLFKARHTLLQLYGRTSQVFSSDILKKKEKMCQDFLDICSLIDPSLSRVGPYAGVAFFEYEDAVMMRVQKLASKEYSDQKVVDQGIAIAKSLLQKCIKALQDEPEDQPEGQLRTIAQKKLTEIGLLSPKK